MANRQSFGRRINAQPTPPAASVCVSPVSTQTELPSVDRELQEWKRARKRAFKVPWRQLSLMASLCFGIASFVLPDSVNNNVQWPLYALMAVSAYVGFSKRRKRATS